MAEGTEVARALRREIPSAHCTSDDSRLMWLWNQRMIVVQSIYVNTKDIRSKMAASLCLTAGYSNDLGAIELLLRRLEGLAKSDEAVVEEDSLPL